MRAQRIVIVATSCFVAVVLCLSATERKPPVDANAYPYGTATCLQGDKGTGVRLFLQQHRHCEGNVSHPYLEVDIREQPISIHKSTSIGSENWAFRCLNPKKSCEQALSGSLVFDHFEDPSGKGLPMDGCYELRFSSGGTESGLFKVDCIAPCG